MKARRHYWLFTGLLLLASTLVRAQTPLAQADQTTVPTLVFFSGVLGALLFMSLFTGAQYLLNRDASYGWYTAYLTLTSIWLWQTVNSWINDISWRSVSTGVSTYFLAFMQILGYGMIVSYLLFLSFLLEVPQQQPRLAHWLRHFFGYMTLSMLTSLAELVVWNSTHMYELTGFFSYIGMLILMAAFLRSNHPLKRYALAGSILLLSSAITSIVLGLSGLGINDRLGNVSLLCIAVGILLEILCFSLALGQRNYLNKVEKIQAQQQLIQQLEENQHLQQSNMVELERQLAQREIEVLSKAHELEDQRINQLQSDLVRRIAEAEMAGLRSQMNPHFIFNCLNSIKLYATENDSEKASDYLTKFSRLIRLVLENSHSELVPLQKELEALQLYIELEAMRFKQKVQFSIHVAPDIDQRFLSIPPLLLQPYVENAIWHGLMHKPEGGTVNIEVSQPQDNLLHIEITDDGVGRERAAELKSKSAGRHKSFGMQVTADRIRMINQLYNIQTQAEVVDLVDSFGEPCGTRVILEIPL